MSETGDMLPQFDRAKIKTPIGFFSTLFRLMKTREERVVPAIVMEYDRQSGVATVLPIVKNLADGADGQDVEIERAECTVPVIRFAHGGYIIDAPLFVGDTGWLVAGDRNSETARAENSAILEENQKDFEKNKGPQKPDDCSLGGFQFGFFIPDSWGRIEIGEEDGLIVKGKRISIVSDNISIAGNGAVNVKVGESSVDIEGDSVTVSSGDRKIVIGKDGIIYSGPTEETLSSVADIRIKSGEIQVKRRPSKRSGNVIVLVGDKSEWETVGQIPIA